MKERIDGERLELIDFALGMLNVADEMSPGFTLNARDRSLDRAFEDASRRLLRLIDAGEVELLNVRFRIATHPIHGDSPRVYEAMNSLFGFGYVEHVQGPYYRFNRGKHKDAEAFHADKRIPGSIDTFRRLSGHFVAINSGVQLEELDEA